MKKIGCIWYCGILMGFVYIIDGIVMVLTFGFLTPRLSIRTATFISKHKHLKNKKCKQF